jgi:hypothetical protein
MSLHVTSLCLVALGLAIVAASLLVRRWPRLRARGAGIFVFGTGIAAAGAM